MRDCSFSGFFVVNEPDCADIGRGFLVCENEVKLISLSESVQGPTQQFFIGLFRQIQLFGSLVD